MAITYYLEWTIERGGEDDYECFDVCVEYTMTAIIPAVVSGPPEHCYPAEGGEVEIQSCWRKADENDVNAPEFKLTDDEITAIEEHIWMNPPEPETEADYWGL